MRGAVLEWSEWMPFVDGRSALVAPNRGGLYRVRRAGSDHLDYIGQTGSGAMHLRARLRMLAGLFATQMPYRDPHTAAPALWALRHRDGCAFEFSVCPVDGDAPCRKGKEALALALYRQETGTSPTANFGRMPSGYRMSSANNARLVLLGRRLRGGAWATEDKSHLPGIAPAGPLTRGCTDKDWGGHAWTAWISLTSAVAATTPPTTGLYRLRAPGGDSLTYVGQGQLRDRLRSHLKTFEEADSEQGRIFREHGPLQCSWVAGPTWRRHQREELETDLIGAHVLIHERPPAGQFIG